MTVNLDNVVAYGAMAWAVSDYFKKAGQKSWGPPPGGFYQNFHMKTKKKKYNKDAVPNAYLDDSAGLWIPAASQNTNVDNFLNKDNSTLRYFWQWTQEGDSNLPDPTSEDAGLIEAEPLDPTERVYDQSGGYKYTSNKFDHINSYNNIEMYSTGQTYIDLSDIDSFVAQETSKDGNSYSDIAATEITYTDKKIDYNVDATTTQTQQDSGITSSATFVASSSVEYSETFGGEYTNTIGTEDTQDVTTSKTTENSVDTSLTVGYEFTAGSELEGYQATASTELEEGYSSSWSTTDELTTSSSSTTEETTSISTSFTVTIDPEPIDDSDGLSFNILVDDKGNTEDYVIEDGDAVVLQMSLSTGNYYNDLNYPYNLSGNFGYFELGTVTDKADPSNESWQGGGSPRRYQGNLGNVAQNAVNYEWWNAMNESSDADVISQDPNNNDYMLVNGSTSTTTGQGAYFILNTYVNGDELTASSRISGPSARLERNSDQFKSTFEKSFLLSEKISERFSDSFVLDYEHQLDAKALRLGLSSEHKSQMPGYHVSSDFEESKLAILLPNRINYVDLEESTSNIFVQSAGSRGNVKLGSGSDVVISPTNGSISIHSGKGKDLIHSFGIGDHIYPGKGSDEVHIHNSSFVTLHKGKDSILYGDNGNASIFNFRPGSSRIGVSVEDESGALQAVYEKGRHRLKETDSPRSFHVSDKSSGEKVGTIRIHSDIDVFPRDYWLDYAVRIKNGKFLKSLYRDNKISGSHNIDRMGSEISLQLESELDNLVEKGRRYFMKKGFMRGSTTFTSDFDEITGNKLHSKVGRLVERIHLGVLEEFGGSEALNDLQQIGIDVSSHSSPQEYVSKIIESGFRGLTSGASFSEAYNSITANIRNELDVYEDSLIKESSF